MFNINKSGLRIKLINLYYSETKKYLDNFAKAYGWDDINTARANLSSSVSLWVEDSKKFNKLYDVVWLSTNSIINELEKSNDMLDVDVVKTVSDYILTLEEIPK